MADASEVARRYFDAVARPDLDAAMACWAPGEVEDGLIKRIDSYWDESALARQIGVLPAKRSRQERVLFGLFNARTRIKSAVGRGGAS